MKVYTVLDYEYRRDNIFSSKEKAEHFIKQNNYVGWVEEIEVDKYEVKNIPIGYNMYYIELLKNGEVRKIKQKYFKDVGKLSDFQIDVFYPGDTYISRKKTAKKFYFIKLFAKNEEQAIRKALEIRHDYIEKGIWGEDCIL